MRRGAEFFTERKALVISIAVVAVLAATALAVGTRERPARPTPEPAPAQTATPCDGKARELGSIATELIFASNRAHPGQTDSKVPHFQIYSKVPGKEPVALTSGAYDHMNPQVSPDGTKLVYYAGPEDAKQIEMLDLSCPTNVTQLTHVQGGVQAYDPTFTADGERILYKVTDINGEYGDIWQMNRDGSDQRQITDDLSERGLEAWKPTSISDDEAIITVQTRPRDPYSNNLYSLIIPDGELRQLTDNDLSNWFPDYNQKTKRVVFITKEQPGGPDVLATMNPDGSDRKLLVALQADSDDPSWRRDGQQVVFINGDKGAYDIYVVNAHGDDSGVSGSTPKLLDKSPVGSESLAPILVTR